MTNPTIPEPGAYRHFKGDIYRVLHTAEQTETGGLLVIYQELYGNRRIYACPLEAFSSKVDREEITGATQEHRFERIEP